MMMTSSSRKASSRLLRCLTSKQTDGWVRPRQPCQGDVLVVSTRDNVPRASSMMGLASIHQQQARCFHLWDVIRSGSLSPSNPLLDAMETGTANFHDLKPHHLTAAAKEVQNQCLANLSVLEGKIHEEDFTETGLLREIDALEIPSRNVLNVASIFAKIFPYDASWKKSVNEAATILTFPHFKSKPLLGALQVIHSTTGVHSKDLERLIHVYQDNGAHLDADRHALLEQTVGALNGVGSRLASVDKDNPNAPTISTKESLQSIYTVIGLKQHEATLQGFETAVDYHLRSRIWTRDEISAQHNLVAERAKPVVENTSPNTLNGLAEAEKELWKYITLDGALNGLFALSTALFGIVVKEDEGGKAWDIEVRLFHIYDQESNDHLGSLYLDPFRRPLKSPDVFMGQFLEESTAATATTFINLNMRPPVWDSMPNQIQLQDAVGLFHEWGHVLQYVLANREKGSINGASHLSLDACEILPQFMEHWLFEESILQTVAHLSFEGQKIPEEIVELVLEHRSTQKAYETLQRAFLGELELSLFSRGQDEEESVVAMQRRIAEEFVAHDIPPKSDLSPTMQLVAANLGGKPIAQYRYLLGEIISSQIFSAFKEVGISNQAEVKRLGGEFRALLLTPGASMNPKASVEQLTGSEMGLESYLKLYRL